MMGTLQSDNYVLYFLLYFTDGVYFCVRLLFKYVMDHIKITCQIK